jgi:hypothetical protein
MDLEPQPLPRKLVEKAKEQGVVKIKVCWSGGDDQGYCDVNVEYTEERVKELGEGCWPKEHHELEREFEEWAEESFDYSGAGDGSAYGDDLVYDLEKNTVQCSDWSMVRQEGEEVECPLELKTDKETA